MTFVPAPLVSLSVFVFLIISLILVFIYSVKYATHHLGTDHQLAKIRTNWFSVGLFLALTYFAALVRSGFLSQKPFPLLPVVFVLMFLSVCAVSFSRVGHWLAQSLTIKWLLLFQVFRLPLELILHDWSSNGTIPETMTWTGQNWDIITGVLALVCFFWAHHYRWLVWTLNTLGLLLLLNVMRVAILSAPLPFSWNTQPPLQLLFYLPYALIGPICVGGALAGHLILYRKLLLKKS